MFNGLRGVIWTEAQWRFLPNDLPSWWVVYQQGQRWLAARVFEAIVDDLRTLLRLAAGHMAEPSAVIIDSRTLQITPESGSSAGCDGAKKRRGRKVHLEFDTLGNLLASYVTAANESDRTQVAELAEQVQGITGGTVEVAFVDQGCSGQAAASQAIHLEVVKVPSAKRGFVLLPRRWVVERSIAWVARFRHLARDYERLPQTLAGLHFLVFAILLIRRFVVTFHFSP